MNWIEITVTATPEAAEAVSNILLDAGAGGVVEKAPAVRVAYLPDEETTPDRIEGIRQAVAGLGAYGLNPGPATVTWTPVNEAVWADAWKDHFHPLRIGQRLVVKPTWREYRPEAEDVVIELDPGMAFGTGTHPTTLMCAQALEESVSEGIGVIDIGTGSGILAIAAARLGASHVWACDTDPVAVQVAQENARLNGVADKIDVMAGSWPGLIENGLRASLVVANIIASVIEEMIPDAHRLLTPGGRLIVSGIASFRRAGVSTTFAQNGWTVQKIVREGDWVAMEATPPASRRCSS